MTALRSTVKSVAIQVKTPDEDDTVVISGSMTSTSDRLAIDSSVGDCRRRHVLEDVAQHL